MLGSPNEHGGQSTREEQRNMGSNQYQLVKNSVEGLITQYRRS